jgi:uncharacterized protein YndB with AHSA1/START domain
MEFRASVQVPRPVTETWDTWVDVARYPQWQGGVLAVRDLHGDVSTAGTSYTLDHGPKMQRQVRVTAADRPHRHVIEQTGFGVDDVTTATFEPDGDGTRLTVTIYMHLNAVMRVLSRLDRRSRMEREVQRELDRFAALAARVAPAGIAGRRYVVRAGAYRRRVVVTAVEADRTHVRVLPGWARWDDPLTTSMKEPPAFPSDFRLSPINPPLRASLDINQHGLPFLVRDGGHGVGHLVLAPGPWADAQPSDDGEAETTDRDSSSVRAWREADGPVIGVDATMDLAPLLTLRLGIDRDGVETWAAAKLLRSEILRVHLAIFGSTWPARPADVDPAVLRLRRMSDEAIERGDLPDLSLGIGHVPIDRNAFSKAEPRFAGITTLRNEELDGYRTWREASGGTFDSLQPLLGWPTDG